MPEPNGASDVPSADPKSGADCLSERRGRDARRTGTTCPLPRPEIQPHALKARLLRGRERELEARDRAAPFFDEVGRRDRDAAHLVTGAVGEQLEPRLDVHAVELGTRTHADPMIDAGARRRGHDPDTTLVLTRPILGEHGARHTERALARARPPIGLQRELVTHAVRALRPVRVTRDRRASVAVREREELLMHTEWDLGDLDRPFAEEAEELDVPR